MALHAGTPNDDAWRLFDDSVKQQVDPRPRPSPPSGLSPVIACVLARAVIISVLTVKTRTTLMPDQVAQNAQPLSNAAAVLGTLCASGHARLAAQQLMSLLKEALCTIHMPRFWSRLAPFAASDTSSDLLEALPAAIQVRFMATARATSQLQPDAPLC